MQCLQNSPLWALGFGGRLTRTRQEAADALLETGLDVPSLEAILQAVESVNRTGWGTIELRLENRQVVNWKYNATGIVARDVR